MIQQSTPPVSLIIPVYNVEKYLARCLDSVLAQTLPGFEVILVNDGSTDGSGDILKEYLPKFKRVVLLEKENGGLGPARNSGVLAATGEFIAFLDSDDTLHPAFLETLYTMAIKNDADVVMCYHNFSTENDRIFFLPALYRSKTTTGKKAFRQLLHDTTYHFFAWNKLCRRTIFLNHKIEMPPICFEDIATTPKLFYYARRVSVTTKRLYNYRQRKGSIMASITYRRIQDNVIALKIIREFLETEGVFDQYKFSFRLLCLKNRVSTGYDILKMHIAKPSKGLFKQMREINRWISRLSSGKSIAVPERQAEKQAEGMKV